MNRLVGMELSNAIKHLESEGKDFEVVYYNDRKMNSHDTTLVLRVAELDGKIQLVATNFLFSPEIKE